MPTLSWNFDKTFVRKTKFFLCGNGVEYVYIFLEDADKEWPPPLCLGLSLWTFALISICCFVQCGFLILNAFFRSANISGRCSWCMRAVVYLGGTPVAPQYSTLESLSRRHSILIHFFLSFQSKAQKERLSFGWLRSWQLIWGHNTWLKSLHPRNSDPFWCPVTPNLLPLRSFAETFSLDNLFLFCTKKTSLLLQAKHFLPSVLRWRCCRSTKTFR